MTKEEEAKILNTLEQVQLFVSAVDAQRKQDGRNCFVPFQDGDICIHCVENLVDSTIQAIKGECGWEDIH